MFFFSVIYFFVGCQEITLDHCGEMIKKGWKSEWSCNELKVREVKPCFLKKYHEPKICKIAMPYYQGRVSVFSTEKSDKGVLKAERMYSLNDLEM